jgi:hypothetical protein
LTTLAQSILDNFGTQLQPTIQRADRSDPQRQAALWLHVHKLLREPCPNDPISMLRQTAQRYVFEDDIMQLSAHLDQTGQIPKSTALQIFKMPSSCMWLEWPMSTCVIEPGEDANILRHFRSGALLEQKGKEIRAILFTRHWRYKEHVFLQAEFMISNWPLQGEHSEYNSPCMNVIWCIQKAKQDTERLFGELRMYLILISYALTLLTIPRVYETRLVDSCPSPKLAKRRAIQGKEPYVTYHHVKLHISRPPVRYEHAERALADPHPSDPNRKRMPWHMVDGHFRTYTKHRDGRPREIPHVVWIEEHDRGNPEIGISIKHREVVR